METRTCCTLWTKLFTISASTKVIASRWNGYEKGISRAWNWGYNVSMLPVHPLHLSLSRLRDRILKLEILVVETLGRMLFLPLRQLSICWILFTVRNDGVVEKVGRKKRDILKTGLEVYHPTTDPWRQSIACTYWPWSTWKSRRDQSPTGYRPWPYNTCPALQPNSTSSQLRRWLSRHGLSTKRESSLTYKYRNPAQDEFRICQSQICDRTDVRAAAL